MVKKKCKNTSGASILIALFFLLLCALAGSVILSAASVSSGRLSNLKKNEQSYYTVSSAARLVKQELEEEKYERYQMFSEDGTLLDDKCYEVPKKELKDFLKKATDTVFDTKDSYEDTWTVETSETVIRDVVAQFSMDKQYNITVTLSEGNAVCILKIPATFSEREETILDDTGAEGEKRQESRITTTVTWTNGVIEKK